MSRFDAFVAVDWSARASLSPTKPTADAIFVCERDNSNATSVSYCRSRSDAMDLLFATIDRRLTAGQRLLIGFDFAFGYPSGFAQILTGSASGPAVWSWLDGEIEDGPDNHNNRFQVAAKMNRIFPGTGPFWGRPRSLDLPSLPERGRDCDALSIPQKRQCEVRVPSAQSPWKLYTTGSVGSQSLMGIPKVHQIQRRFGAACQVWPFDTGFAVPTAPLVLCEIYPTLFHQSADTHRDMPTSFAVIKDAQQVWDCCATFQAMQQSGQLPHAFTAPVKLPNAEAIAREEGWILGAE